MRPRVLGLGLAACLALAATPKPRLLWNATASVPVGLYRLLPPTRLAVGELVVVRPDPVLASRLAEDGRLPRGVPLIKPIAAGPGQVVCRRGSVVTIDGRRAALALTADGQGRALPAWRGCRTLDAGEAFLLAPAPGSFDGRYFGPTDAGRFVARARPLWVRPPGALR